MKLKYIKLAVLSLVVGLTACDKNQENLEVDLSKYNYDNPEKLPIDDYIYNNLTKPYNIEVVYRFDRSHTDINKNISPPKIENIQPAVDMVIKGFLKPYEKLGGERMIKTYTPKQFVLFGSHAYNDNGSVTLGTADGGRRVVLYDINNISNDNGDGIKRRLRTIHHEFAHILNQMIDIPPSFRTVTADHVDNWLAAENTAAEAKRLGFISQYSRSSYGEDFAEMVAHLLVEGQVWFDNYASEIAETKYRDRLKLKEAIVREYFKSFFNIEFSELQAEVQRVLKDEYKATFPVDKTQDLHFKLLQDKISTIRYTRGASYLTTYGSSTAFATVFNNARDEIKLSSTFANADIDYIEFRFDPSDSNGLNFIFRINWRTTPTSSTYNSDYYFKATVNPANGEINFTKAVRNGVHSTGYPSYTNGTFEKVFLPYLTARTFVASWLPTTITPDNAAYRTYGGFYVKGASSNYVYGPVVNK